MIKDYGRDHKNAIETALPVQPDYLDEKGKAFVANNTYFQRIHKTLNEIFKLSGANREISKLIDDINNYLQLIQDQEFIFLGKGNIPKDKVVPDMYDKLFSPGEVERLYDKPNNGQEND